MDSIEHLYGLHTALKKSSRHLVTNCYLDKQILESLIREGKLFFLYEPGAYINMYCKERDFIRLYYYIADLDLYSIGIDNEKIVCDRFYMREGEKNESVDNVMKKNGMKKYATYHKWVRKDQEILNGCDDYDRITILEGYHKGYHEAIEQYFDVYSDLIPQYEDTDKYFCSKKCYSAILKDTQKLAGGLVTTKQGDVETEEFIFVHEEYRNRGIADRLHNFWYANPASNGNTRFVAWIRDDNEKSIKLHLKNGFVKKPTHKITMMRG